MRQNRCCKCLMLILAMAVFLIGCADDESANTGASQDAAAPAPSMLLWPDLTPLDLDGGKLRVVATTSIIGDVTANVGGDAIELTTLMPPGQDPHGYVPAAQDLTAVADAHVIILNGWGLEEGLIATLQNIAGDAPLVPISARIPPLNGERGVDPHTWLDPHNVVQWTDNLKSLLSDLDPANADLYAANADAYRAELADLIALYDEQIGAIPMDGRLLVTNHNSLGYLAQAYRFEVIATVLPSASALAEPSASSLTDLVATMTEAGVCAIFTETTANDQLAQAAAAELARCESVAVTPLYTGALGLPDSGAETYIKMMESNLAAITAVLP